MLSITNLHLLLCSTLCYSENMKIYVGHSKELNFEEELYHPLRQSNLNSEHEIIFPHENNHKDAGFVTRDVIKNCDLMLAEVSFPATGLGIELGWADSFGRPIICIHRNRARLSGSLKIICNNFIVYTDKHDLIDKLTLTLNSYDRRKKI